MFSITLQNSVPDFFVALMIYAFISVFFVLGVKLITSLRLRGLKVRLEAIQPEIDRLRADFAKSEGELAELKLKVEEKEQLFLNFGRYSPNI